MKKLYTLIALLVCFTAQAQKVDWVKNVGHNGNDQGLRCNVDMSGNLLFAGTFTDSIDFGDGNQLKGNGGTDAFLAKTNPSGTIIWARALTGPGKSHTVDGRSITSDSDGNIYVIGTFVDTLYANGQTLFGVKETPLTKDIFIAKYTSAGTLTWINVFKGPGSDMVEDVEVLGDKLAIVGYYNSTLTIGSQTFQSEDINNPTNNPYVAVFNLNGQPLWIDKIDCKLGFCRALSISPNGKINVFIEAKGSPVIRTVGTSYQASLKQSENSGESVDDYIIQLNQANGSLVWTNRMGSLGSEMGYAITTDASNNIFMSGLFQQTIKIESTDGKYKTGTSKGGFDFFVCKYNALGQLQWATFEGDVKTDGVRDIAVNALGYVYLAGYFIDQTKIGDSTFKSSGTSTSIQAFLAQYAPSGTFKWAMTAPASRNTSYFTALTTTPAHTLVLTGYFKGDGIFLDKSVISNPFDATNIWFASLSEKGNTGIFLDPNNVEVSAYPLPANDLITIRVDHDQHILRTRIYNVIGNAVLESSTGDIVIPVSNLKNGVYLLEVLTNKGQSVQKIIIRR